MRLRSWTFSLVLAVVLGLIAAFLFLLEDGSDRMLAEPPAPDPSAPDTPAPPAATEPPPPEPSPPSPTATPTPTPTEDAAGADARPDRCAAVPARAAALIDAVEATMSGYEGDWGLALIDLDCDSATVARPDHAQYPASAGKIVILTAALRAVEDGLLAFDDIEENLELVLRYSLDKSTDEIAEFLTPEQVGAVMERAGVSAYSWLQWDWRESRFTAHDLARVWASILRGDQLGGSWTDYLLTLASEAVLPEADVTFPADFSVAGYQYGQKAGYWKPEEDPDFFVSAGYIRPEDGASAGFAFAFLLRTPEEDPFEPKRRSVFPLVRDFVVAEVERNR